MNTTMQRKTTCRVSKLSTKLQDIFNDPSALGLLVGSRCEFTCDKRLHHVFCNPISNKCECEKNYPVKIGGSRVSLYQTLKLKIFIYLFLAKGPRKGCAKRK